MQDNILPTNNNFKNYLETQNSNNLSLSLTTQEKISDNIQTLKLNKSTAPNDLNYLSLKVLKRGPFSEMLNQYSHFQNANELHKISQEE